jgi:PEP-CTERM motif-containing protein
MIRKSLLAFALLAVLRGTALASPITVNEVLYDSSGVADSTLLSGTVDMTFAGDTLTIVLRNTSADGAGSGAGILLTGVAFTLPSGVSIASGVVTIGSSTAVNFTAPLGGDISSEWGYDNSPLDSGSFLNDASYDYNSVVASMVSMTTTQFSSGSIGAPPNLGGPDFGAISAAETDAGGQEAVRDTITFTLLLNGQPPSDLVSFIDSNPVGISFGSPNVSVPEPASLSLLALGAVMLGARARQRRKQ